MTEEMTTETREVREKIEVTEAMADNARLILKEIVTTMGFIAEVEMESFEDNTVYLSISSEDQPGLLIGKAGNTMKSLQQIVSSIMSKKHQNRIYVKIDINQYWKRREDEIIASALDAAKVAEEEEISVMLEPMNAEERRIVHLSVQDKEDVFSYSEGDGPIKQVVIAHSKLKDEAETDDNNG